MNIYILEFTTQVAVAFAVPFLFTFLASFKPNIILWQKQTADSIVIKTVKEEIHTFLRFHYGLVFLLVFILALCAKDFTIRIDELSKEIKVGMSVISKMEKKIEEDSVSSKTFEEEFNSLTKIISPPPVTRSKISLILTSYKEIKSLNIQAALISWIFMVFEVSLYFILLYYSFCFVKAYLIQKNIVEHRHQMALLKPMLKRKEFDALEGEWALLQTHERFVIFRKKKEKLLKSHNYGR